MQYLEYAVLGVCLLIFLGVVAFVVIALVAQAMRGPKKPAVATLYPIPPAERGSPQHVTLYTLVDQHKAEILAEEARDELKKKIRDVFMNTPPPPPKP